jgi:hypothetical protein
VRLGVAQQGARHVLELIGPVAEVRRVEQPVGVHMLQIAFPAHKHTSKTQTMHNVAGTRRGGDRRSPPLRGPVRVASAPPHPPPAPPTQGKKGGGEGEGRGKGRGRGGGEGELT